MTEARGVCHSEESSDEESQAVLECCVYILTNETHSLHMEPVGPTWVDLNAERSDALDSSRSLP